MKDSAIIECPEVKPQPIKAYGQSDSSPGHLDQTLSFCAPQNRAGIWAPPGTETPGLAHWSLHPVGLRRLWGWLGVTVTDVDSLCKEPGGPRRAGQAGGAGYPGRAAGISKTDGEVLWAAAKPVWAREGRWSSGAWGTSITWYPGSWEGPEPPEWALWPVPEGRLGGRGRAGGHLLMQWGEQTGTARFVARIRRAPLHKREWEPPRGPARGLCHLLEARSSEE